MYEGACNMDDYVNDDDEAVARRQALEDGDEAMEAEGTAATEERDETMEDLSRPHTPVPSSSRSLPQFRVN